MMDGEVTKGVMIVQLRREKETEGARGERAVDNPQLEGDSRNVR